MNRFRSCFAPARSRLVVMVLIAVSAFVAPAASALDVDVPLEGYYRPGAYMPLSLTLDADDDPQSVEIEGSGIVPTRWTPRRSRTIVPILPTGASAVAIHVGGRSVPVRPLDDGERLIGDATTGGDGSAGLARSLFAHATPLIIRLDPVDPIPGHPAAWSSLDALLLDSADGLTDDTIATLLAAGVTIAVRSERAPGGAWPWRQQGAWRVLHRSILGPTGLLLPQAYEPLASWRPGVSAGQRRTVLLGAGVFSIAFLMAALLRARWAVSAGLLLTAGAVTAIALATADPRPTVEAGVLLVPAQLTTQLDFWRAMTARQAMEATAPFGQDGQFARPIFASRQHRELLRLRLEWNDRDDEHAFHYALPANGKLIFLSRTVAPSAVPPSRGGAMADWFPPLARSLYLTPHRHLDRPSGSTTLILREGYN